MAMVLSVRRRHTNTPTPVIALLFVVLQISFDAETAHGSGSPALTLTPTMAALAAIFKVAGVHPAVHLNMATFTDVTVALNGNAFVLQTTGPVPRCTR